MAFDNSFTAVTGATYTAAQYNTYTKGNFAAMWVYTTAGDLAYASSATALSRLAIGAAYKVLRVNPSGNAPSWGQSPIVFTSKTDSTEYSYSTDAWRDVPNSSATITPLVASTVLVFGVMNNYGTGTYGFRRFKVSIDGIDVDGYESWEYYQINEYVATPVFGVKTGVAAGAKTIKLREICDSPGYTVSSKWWIAVAIPE